MNEFKIITTILWDDNFFDKWQELYLKIYPPEEFLTEDADNLRTILIKGLFPEESWKAYIVLDQNNLPLARGLVTVNREHPNLAKLGYFEFVDDLVPVKFLLSQVEKDAKESGIKSIKAPIHFNFFLGYRLRLKSTEPLFYGEPQEPYYYQEIYQHLGFKLLRTWDSFKLNHAKTRENFSAIRKKKQPEKKLKLRNIRLNDFENEMKIVFQLFKETYQNMPEYESMSFEAFYQIYKSFKYIIHPFFSYLVFDGEKPVGFCINYTDPYEILLAQQKNDKKSKIEKLKLLIRLRLNFKRLLIIYVGRNQRDEYKGVQSLVAKRLAVMSFIFRVKDAFVCYTASDSPAKRSFNMNDHIIISSYGLFGKDL